MVAEGDLLNDAVISHKIVPRISVGAVFLGSTVQDLLSLGFTERMDEPDIYTGWTTFTRDDGLNCYVEDGRVISIACFSHCSLNGFALIGVSDAEMASVLGVPDEVGEPIRVDEERQQTPCEYDALGMQVWLENARVVSVFFNAAD